VAFAFPLGERYDAPASPVHRADARVKLVAAVGYILAIASTPQGTWYALALLAVPIAIVALLAHLSLVGLLRRSLLALPFVLAALPLAFTREGQTVWTVPLAGWSASREGIEAVASIMGRSWLSVLTASVLTGTTSPTELVRALRALRVPRILAATMFFTYRYLFTIGDEGLRLMRGRDSRSARLPGYRSGGTLAWRARVLGNMVGTLFLRSYERSERVFAAMQSRGYNGEPRFLDAPVLRAREVMAAAALVAYGVLVVTSAHVG
jgi:cobalt/nickel transport system permease protein